MDWIFLLAFHQSVRKSQKLSPKFYYFDLGVKNSLSKLVDSKPVAGSSVFGELFEQFLICEIFRLNEYFQKDYRLSFLSTKNNAEIDLILSKGRKHYAIEIKSTQSCDRVELKKLATLASDIKNISEIFYISNQKTNQISHNVNCMYWRDFLLHFVNNL